MTPPLAAAFLGALFAAACSSAGIDVADERDWPEDAEGPAGMGPGVRVFAGTAATLSARTSCTADDAEGDRWCAFVGLSSAGESNLFVVNVTAVMAGVPVRCNEPDENCLLLTDHLVGGSADYHPTYFGGDTLVYYDREFAAYVWQPGMDAGRLLATREAMSDIAFCDPAPRGPAVACLGLAFEQPGPNVFGDVYAGSRDGESEPLLGPIDSVIVATPEDTDRVHRFAFGTLADGYVAWSRRQTDAGPEDLELQHVDDPASRISVASDVHEWSVTDDLGHWLWIRAANELGFGRLQTANFPDGADPTDLHSGVFEFQLNRAGALIALTMDDELVSIPDPIGAPDDQVLLDGDVGEIVALSERGHVAYARRAENGVYADLVVASLDGTRSCLLDSSGTFSRSVHFSRDEETVIWARANADQYDGYHSLIGDCSSVDLSPAVAVIGWIGGHAVFVDAVDPETSAGSLHFRKVSSDGELDPAPPTLIAERVDSYVSWGPDFLLYTISQGTFENGAYVRAFGEYAQLR